MSTESQREFILRLLKDYGHVSAHDLVFKHGITRAGARIWELRREGYPIVTDPSRVLEDGSRSMAVYRLPRAEQPGASLVSLRRYTELKQSSGTHFPSAVVAEIRARDQGCIGPRVGMPGTCDGPLDPDHVRASGGVGMKSRSTADNGVMLCRFVHHRMKTLEGRRWRPRLLGHIAAHS